MSRRTHWTCPYLKIKNNLLCVFVIKVSRQIQIPLDCGKNVLKVAGLLLGCCEPKGTSKNKSLSVATSWNNFELNIE